MKALALCVLAVSCGRADASSDLAFTVYGDMNDGTWRCEKSITIKGTNMTIRSFNDSVQKWAIQSVYDAETQSAMVDFRVPGKANPPPVPLLATAFRMQGIGQAGGTIEKLIWEFTDPSGRWCPPSTVVNHWVPVGEALQSSLPALDCGSIAVDGVYQDIHGHDTKLVRFQGGLMTLKPISTSETWEQTATFDKTFCNATLPNATILWKVPRAGNHTALPLAASMWKMANRSVIQFTDPSGTFGATDYPLNHLVLLSQIWDLPVKNLLRGFATIGASGYDPVFRADSDDTTDDIDHIGIYLHTNLRQQQQQQQVQQHTHGPAKLLEGL